MVPAFWRILLTSVQIEPRLSKVAVNIHRTSFEMFIFDGYSNLLYYLLVNKSCRVWATKFAEKQIKKLPKHIAAAYHTWVKTVELDGIRATRTLPGYHDEPLKGERKGQRSVRLSRGYRVIYEETETGNIVLIGVQEVNKHEY